MNYIYLKVVHVLLVVLFLGNIITGLFWMRIAIKTKDWKIIAHSMNGVIKSDKIFTIPGVVFITISGIASAIIAGIPLLKTGWIFWSLISFSICGILFGWKVAPLQKKTLAVSKSYENTTGDWKHFEKVYQAWEMWGLLSLITGLAPLVMMVLKMPTHSPL